MPSSRWSSFLSKIERGGGVVALLYYQSGAEGGSRVTTSYYHSRPQTHRQAEIRQSALERSLNLAFTNRACRTLTSTGSSDPRARNPPPMVGVCPPRLVVGIEIMEGPDCGFPCEGEGVLVLRGERGCVIK